MVYQNFPALCFADNFSGRSPAACIQTVPGIGPRLAQRIHDTLGVETLEALEVACHEGRLGEVAGVGQRRAAAGPSAAAEPSVAVLLDVDREYLDKARAGTLPTITPWRFNPEQKAWLPVLHTGCDAGEVIAGRSDQRRASVLEQTGDALASQIRRGKLHGDQRIVDGERIASGARLRRPAGPRCASTRPARSSTTIERTVSLTDANAGARCTHPRRNAR